MNKGKTFRNVFINRSKKSFHQHFMQSFHGNKFRKILVLIIAMAMILNLTNAMADLIPKNGTGSIPEDPLFDPSFGITLTVYTTNFWAEDTKPDAGLVKEWIEARTGLTLNFNYTAMDNYVGKMNLMFIGDTHFDAFPDVGNPAVSLARTLQGLYDDGIIIDISSYLEEYGQNLIKYIGKGFDYVRATDGAILAIPVRLSNHRGYTPCIRADWAEKAGFTDHLPSSIEELETYFQYVLDNDVNDNGDPKDEIPFLPTQLGNLALGMKGIFMGSDGFGWQNTAGSNYLIGSYLTADGIVKSTPDNEHFMDFLDYMRDWYIKGYIYPEFLTITQAQVDDMIRADRVGMTSQWYSNMIRPFQTVEEADPSKHYELLPNIASPFEDVESCYTEFKEFKARLLISSKSEHPEVAIAYCDWMLSDPTINCTVWNGLEGVHWKWVDKDNYVFSTIDDGASKYFKCFQCLMQFDAEDQFLYANPDNYVAIKYDYYLKDMNSDKRVYKEAFDLKVPYTKMGTEMEFINNDSPTWLEESVAAYILGILSRDGMVNAIAEYDTLYGDVYSQVYTEQYNTWLEKLKNDSDT